MDELHRGRVTKVTNNGVFVTVPELGIGMEFGPCETGCYVEVGDSVLVTQVSGVKEDIVVVVRLKAKYQYEPVLTVNGEKGPFATIDIGM